MHILQDINTVLIRICRDGAFYDFMTSRKSCMPIIHRGDEVDEMIWHGDEARIGVDKSLQFPSSRLMCC